MDSESSSWLATTAISPVTGTAEAEATAVPGARTSTPPGDGEGTGETARDDGLGGTNGIAGVGLLCPNEQAAVRRRARDKAPTEDDK